MSNTKINTKKFYDYMAKYKVKPGQKRTHTSMGKPYGSYNIKNETRFFNLYNKALQENAHLHIVEVHKECGPIIIDIDILQNESQRNYNIEIKKYVNTSNIDYNIFIT